MSAAWETRSLFRLLFAAGKWWPRRRRKGNACSVNEAKGIKRKGTRKDKKAMKAMRGIKAPKIVQAPPAMKAMKAPCKRPAAAVSFAKTAHPPAPIGTAANPPPKVTYRGAFIYTSWTTKTYGCILDPAEKSADARFAWFGDMKAAWKRCMLAIDAHRDS